MLLHNMHTAAESIELTLTTSSNEVKKMIDELNDAFDSLKKSIKECLEKLKIAKDDVADALTSLSPDDNKQHKMFAESHKEDLYRADNISEQFGTMNSHWNYLNPHLLYHLVKKFKLRNIKDQMEGYESKLQQFRMKTPLSVFCRTQKRRNLDPPQSFRKAVAHFDWRNGITLEDVEQFQQEYASDYSLHECAMMIAQIRPGSYIITWFIPVSVVEKLKAKVPREILKKYCVTKMDIAGVCVYRSRKALKVSGTDCNGSI